MEETWQILNILSELFFHVEHKACPNYSCFPKNHFLKDHIVGRGEKEKKLKQFFFIFYLIYKNISLNFTKHYEVRNSKNWKKSAIRNGYQFSYFAFMLLITTTSKRFQLSL